MCRQREAVGQLDDFNPDEALARFWAIFYEEDVDALWPEVERLFPILSEAGFIEKSEGSWAYTDAGRERLSPLGLSSPRMAYSECERDWPRAWAAVDNEITELVTNKDLVETTHRHYIVGSIVRALVAARLLEPE